jgi:cysteinyl-tRNA synthetase
MTFRLYNTASRRKEDFAPIDAKAVRLYVCGPTVYDFAHIGNARPVIVFDVLFRLLRHLYGPDHVIYARNITDVDDKINARAERDYPCLPLNDAIARVTEATERQFHDDVAALGCLDPTEEPRATQYIATMRAMIERLIARGVAYVAEDHVLFSPAAMDALPGAPRYGALARRSLDEMLAGARVETAPYKRAPMDFVLWKPSKPNEPGWPSPAGIAALGRPGWHIECSAMSMARLLEPFGGGLACDDPSRNVFDIHGGGIDLVFPHHENEIAQSCCAFGSKRMANIWMHNGFLQVEGEKMSKSLGNFVTIRELLRGWNGEAWSGAAIRLAMLGTQYRQPLDWTLERLTRAKAEIHAIAEITSPSSFQSPDFYNKAWTERPTPSQYLVETLSDDLNTVAAVAVLSNVISNRNLLDDVNRTQFVHDIRFLGLISNDTQRSWLSGTQFASNITLQLVGLASAKFKDYRVAVANNDTQMINEFKNWSAAQGIEVQGSDRIIFKGSGRSIEDLLKERNAARQRKDWTESDRLRSELEALGVVLKDTREGTTWEFKR